MAAKITVYEGQSRSQAWEASQEQLVEIAGKIAADASALAPVQTGTYAGSFHVTESDGVRVESSDPDAIHKEYGTSNTPAHAALTEAAMQYGKYSGTRPR